MSALAPSAKESTNVILHYEIDENEKLGSGSFGDVFTATHDFTKEKVAAKKIQIKVSQWKGFEKRRESAMKEFKSTKDKDVQVHPNIAKIFDYFEIPVTQTEYCIWIMYELCDLGNLRSYSLTYSLQVEHMVRIMAEMASAVAYLHSRDPPLLHRNIKPDNMLFTMQDLRHVLKLTDLGIPRMIERVSGELHTEKASIKAYHAPELFKDASKVRTDMKGFIDVFAAGLVFHQMIEARPGRGIYCADVEEQMYGKLMWENRKSWTNKQALVIINPSDDEVMKKLKCLVLSMIQLDPKQRKPMKEVEEELKALKDALPTQTGNPLQAIDPNMCQTTAPTIRRVHCQELDASMSPFVSFSEDAIILESWNNPKFVKYSLEEGGGTLSYQMQWERQRPDDIPERSMKYCLPSGHIVTRYTDQSPTVILDSELNPLYSYEGDYGALCGIIHGDKLLYSKFEKPGRWRLDMYHVDNHQHLCTLSRSARSAWISTASHPRSGWFVVVDSVARTLNTFTPDFGSQCRVQLDFVPRGLYAVVCAMDFILVAKYNAGVVVYNWLGKEVGRPGREALGVDDNIWGIGGGAAGRVQMVTGELHEGFNVLPTNTVSSLAVFDVE